MAYSPSSPILGTGQATPDQIDAFFAEKGKQYAPNYAPDRMYRPAPEKLGQYIVEEARRYTPRVVNHDLLAAQIVHESAAWQSRYARERNNPSGLGAVNHDPDQALVFASPRDGIRATVAHLLTYVVGEGPWTADDPRYGATPAGWRGAVAVLADLQGKWAYPGDGYAAALATIANQLLEMEQPMSAQIPGFLWVPAESDHYTRGRTQQVRGGAQHYTAGTNSLAWLTRTSGRAPGTEPVSAHFLVKHEPTLHDRGWQLVRIEDTAWTTAFANPYTVSIEYEHAGGPVSHEALIVLAQTWIDIAAYVTAHGLGEIELDRTGIRGHKEWVNNPGLTCPDGIDVDTLVGVIRDLQKTPQKPVEPPRITKTVPDPWGKDNPWHKGYWIPIEFVDHIRNKRTFLDVGYCMSEAFEEGGLIVQYFERKRLELHPGQVVMEGLVGAEALWARYPNRRPPVRTA